MTAWKPKAAVAIVVLGISSLLYALLSPAKRRLANDHAAVGLLKPISSKRASFKDLLKSDPVHAKTGAPRKDKLRPTISLASLSFDPPRHEFSHSYKKTQHLESTHDGRGIQSSFAIGPHVVRTEASKVQNRKRGEYGPVAMFLRDEFLLKEKPHPDMATIETLEVSSDSPNKNQKGSENMTTSDRPQPRTVTGWESLEKLLTDQVRTTKLTPEGQIDWSYYDAIELYHTRKAGGTSLYVWAAKIAQKHGLDMGQQEGSCYDPQDTRYINRKVLVFTSLRPPVERVISSFEYDSVQTQNFPNTTLRNFFDRANQVNKYGRNQRNVWQHPAHERLLTGKKQVRFKLRRKRKEHEGAKKVTRGWIWQCATDCYSKWFGGWPTANLVADTYTAVERLNDLEVVWIKNSDNPEYMAWLLHRWNATDIPLGQKRETANQAKHNYTQREMRLLEVANQRDEWLYETLRRKWSRITNMTLV